MTYEDYMLLFFIFMIFYEFYAHLKLLVNPRFDKDLNKFKIWKWKGKALQHRPPQALRVRFDMTRNP
jgi:hypothetical protein